MRLVEPGPRLAAGLRDRFGVAVTDARAAAALRAEIAYYRAHMDRGGDAPGLHALRRDCAQVLRDALGLGLDCDLDAMTDVLLDALRFEAFDDARPALARARQAGARVIVVSNWDVSLPDVLQRVGLAPLLDGVLTSAAIGVRKPDPAIFAAALGLAAVDANACRHVGDSLTEDVAGARAAGIEAVLLDRDGTRGGDGVPVIASLDELAWP